ncbi:hypothetical protein BKA69DRAFT_476361 [Paraphysoderma sedebokerense]|nr:hypothetical protein BKA69DRAFT_476361 [Paraphysoderma sedebokerense]
MVRHSSVGCYRRQFAMDSRTSYLRTVSLPTPLPCFSVFRFWYPLYRESTYHFSSPLRIHPVGLTRRLDVERCTLFFVISCILEWLVYKSVILLIGFVE